MNNLLTTLFAIQKQILSEMPDGHELVDSGMYLLTGKEKTHWRDATIEVESDKCEYSFSYSTDGELKGEVPPRMVLSVNSILNSYR
jgi:hypothetical protein